MKFFSKPWMIFCSIFLGSLLLWQVMPGWSQSAANSKPALYDFGMGMCIPCKDMEKVLNSIKSKYGNQIEVRLIMAEKERPMFEKYKIVGVPTQVFLDTSGKEVDRHVGAYTEDELVKKLKELKFIQ
jgi:thioredoxin 1